MRSCIESAPAALASQPVRTIRLRSVLNRDLPEIDGHYVYVIRDRELVLYAGQTIKIMQRLRAHLGTHRLGNSPIGALFHENHPQSQGWQVDIYNPREFGSTNLLAAERFAIGFFAPLLNNNDDPDVLPPHYRRERFSQYRQFRLGMAREREMQREHARRAQGPVRSPAPAFWP